MKFALPSDLLDLLILCCSGIGFLLGIFATLLGYRLIGRKPGQVEAYDKYYARVGKHLKWIGPLIIALCSIVILSGMIHGE